MATRGEYTKLLQDGSLEMKQGYLESLLNAIFTKKHKLDINPYIPILLNMIPLSESKTQKLILDIIYAIAVTMPKMIEKQANVIRDTIKQVAKDDIKQNCHLTLEVLQNIEMEQNQATRRHPQNVDQNVSQVTNFTQDFLVDQEKQEYSLLHSLRESGDPDVIGKLSLIIDQQNLIIQQLQQGQIQSKNKVLELELKIQQMENRVKTLENSQNLQTFQQRGYLVERDKANSDIANHRFQSPQPSNSKKDQSFDSIRKHSSPLRDQYFLQQINTKFKKESHNLSQSIRRANLLINPSTPKQINQELSDILNKSNHIAFFNFLTKNISQIKNIDNQLLQGLFLKIHKMLKPDASFDMLVTWLTKIMDLKGAQINFSTINIVYQGISNFKHNEVKILSKQALNQLDLLLEQLEFRLSFQKQL